MRKSLLIFCLILVAASFIVFVLSLLQFVPRLIAIPLLFFSILITVSFVNNRHRFRGFDN